MFVIYDSHPVLAVVLAYSIPTGITQTFWREARNYKAIFFCDPPSWLMRPLYCESLAKWSNIVWAVFCGKWYWAVVAWLLHFVIAALIDRLFVRQILPDTLPSQRSWEPNSSHLDALNPLLYLERHSEFTQYFGSLKRRWFAAGFSALICLLCGIAPWVFQWTK
jgi:hypothetical protein